MDAGLGMPGGEAGRRPGWTAGLLARTLARRGGMPRRGPPSLRPGLSGDCTLGISARVGVGGPQGADLSIRR